MEKPTHNPMVAKSPRRLPPADGASTRCPRCGTEVPLSRYEAHRGLVVLSCTPKLTPGRAVEMPNKPHYVEVIGYVHGLGSPGWPRMLLSPPPPGVV